MLLRREHADGVEVLSVCGPVGDDEAGHLLDAVQQAVAQQPRALVLYLGEVSELSAAARTALHSLPQLPASRGQASIVACHALRAHEPAGWVHVTDREQALAQVDRRAAPRTTIDVEHSLQGPSQARAALHQCSTELGETSDDVVLLVSELVTNAVRHGTPPVRLEVLADADVVRVSVGDGDPGLPRPRALDDEAEGGRGMVLVDELASDHGVRRQPPGKTVWASVTRPGGARP